MKKFILFFCLIIFSCSNPKIIREEVSLSKIFNEIQLLKNQEITSQVLFVYNDDKNSNYAKAALFEKVGENWIQKISDKNVRIGSKGFAEFGKKKEGDGKSPSGLFELGMAFGYENNFKINYPYKETTEKDIWIDDAKSGDYNKWITGNTDAKSFEKLKGPWYKIAIVVEYNTNPVIKGLGSAIFVHLEEPPNEPTSGCVAFRQNDLLEIINLLDKNKHPMILMGSKETL